MNHRLLAQNHSSKTGIFLGQTFIPFVLKMKTLILLAIMTVGFVLIFGCQVKPSSVNDSASQQAIIGQEGNSKFNYEIVLKDPTVFGARYNIFTGKEPLSNEDLIDLNEYLIQRYQNKNQSIYIEYFTDKEAAKLTSENLLLAEPLEPVWYGDGDERYTQEMKKYADEKKKYDAEKTNWDNSFYAELYMNVAEKDNEFNNILKRKQPEAKDFETIKKY